jgi:hypothetical protein
MIWVKKRTFKFLKLSLSIYLYNILYYNRNNILHNICSYEVYLLFFVLFILFILYLFVFLTDFNLNSIFSS